MANNRWSAWSGPDVEGRLYGVQTLFLFNLGEWSESELYAALRGFSHVLFGENWFDEHGILGVREALDLGLVATLEVRPDQLAKLPEDVRRRGKILLALSGPPELDLLKATDEVRLLIRPFNAAVAQWQSFDRTCPEDYEVDVPVLRSESGKGDHPAQELGE